MNRRSACAIALVTCFTLAAWNARADEGDDDTEEHHEEPEAKEKPAAPADTTPPADDAAKARAKETLTAYLDAVKAKKWAEAKKYIHPKALQDIAEIKKRTGEENHGLATWARAATDAYMTDYKLGDPQATGKGAVVIPSTEEEFDVNEKGTESDIKAQYLLIPLDGKWYVADRRKGEGDLFPAKTVGLSYKGYFQGEYVPPPEAAPARTKASKKKKKHKSEEE